MRATTLRQMHIFDRSRAQSRVRSSVCRTSQKRLDGYEKHLGYLELVHDHRVLRIHNCHPVNSLFLYTIHLQHYWTEIILLIYHNLIITHHSLVNNYHTPVVFREHCHHNS